MCGARMKGGAQKHWRQNAFHSHSGGRPEVPYFFLARLFAVISNTLSSLLHGIWLCGTLSDIKAVHTRSTSACDKLVFFRIGGGLYANLHKPGSQRQWVRGSEFGRERAHAVGFTRQVIPRYTRDVQTRAWEKTKQKNKRLAALIKRVWNYVSVYLISL